MMTVKKMREVLFMSQAEFSRKYNIPKRSIENWEGGQRACPEYVIGLLNRVVLLDVKDLYEKRLIKEMNRLKSDEDDNRPQLQWVNLHQYGGDESVEPGTFEECVKRGGRVACIAVNQGTSNWYCDRDGNIYSDYDSFDADEDDGCDSYYFYEEGHFDGRLWSFQEILKYLDPRQQEELTVDEKVAYLSISDIVDLEDYIDNYVNNIDGEHFHDYIIEKFN